MSQNRHTSGISNVIKIAKYSNDFSIAHWTGSVLNDRLFCKHCVQAILINMQYHIDNCGNQSIKFNISMSIVPFLMKMKMVSTVSQFVNCCTSLILNKSLSMFEKRIENAYCGFDKKDGWQKFLFILLMILCIDKNNRFLIYLFISCNGFDILVINKCTVWWSICFAISPENFHICTTYIG